MEFLSKTTGYNARKEMVRTGMAEKLTIQNNFTRNLYGKILENVEQIKNIMVGLHNITNILYCN